MASKSDKSLWDRFRGFLTSWSSQFKEESVSTDPINTLDWSDWPARSQRYRMLWAFYEGTAYSPVHKWSKEFRKVYSLYTWTRNIYSPAYRLGEFWSEHLTGGALDPEAGDGKGIPSGLPIVTKNDRLRPMIGRIWQASNWSTKKAIWGRWGATLGDVFLQPVDDPNRQQVCIKPVHPAFVTYVSTDDFGNIKGYVIERMRRNPDWDATAPGLIRPFAVYKEECVKEGESIIFKTFKDDIPYDWRIYGPRDRVIGPEWVENYGFVPLVMAKHLDVGFDFGWSEYQAALSKIREADDQGSILTDQGRRILNSPWLINGRKPSDKLFGKAAASDEMASPAPATATTGTTEVIGRDKMQLIWVDPTNNNNKPVQPFQLVGPMPIGEIGMNIDRVLGSLEKDYPELRLEGAETGDSGRARRVARQKAEAKVHARRAGYDDALARAQMMALSMGGTRGEKFQPYPGFDGITESSFRDGDLLHSIGKRPVFAIDPMDEVEEEQARATVIRTYKEAGVPASLAMRRLGYAEDDVRAQETRDAKREALADAVAESKLGGTDAGTGIGTAQPPGSKPIAQESVAPQNRGALPPTDLQNELYARPGVTFETRAEAR
jgi:hypothetical protein